MSAWNAALVATLALAGVAFVLQAYALRRGKDLRLAILGATVLAAGILWAAFLFLLTRFIVVDVSYQYVFQYTSTTTPLEYRIAGTWTGREGSLLLWTAYTATAAAVLAWRRPAEESRARDWMMLFLLAILALFLWAIVAQDTFAATSDFLLQGRPQGNGLNPLLRSPFILIHPPLMFLAYALTAVTASAALASTVADSRAASRIDLPWSRVNWLLYTVAIGLGGIWAYYTLGFGGYWGWDPVELANLLPWIALTVFLHAQIHHIKHGAYAFALPFLGLLPFLLTLFSAISTRSGLWFSVHAFTDPSSTFNPDASRRFLGILELEPIVAFYVGLLLATLLVGLALWGRSLAAAEGHLVRWSRLVAALYGAAAAYALVDPGGALGLALQAGALLPGPMSLGLVGVLFAVTVVPALPGLAAPQTGPQPASRRFLNERSLLYASVLTLSIGLLLFILFHFQTVNGWDRAFYDARFPWLITPVLVLLILLQGHALLPARRLALLVAASLAAAGAAWLLVPGERGGAYLVVLATAALAVGLERLRRAMTNPSAARRVKVGGFLLWTGALLDLVFWVNPPSRIGVGAFTWQAVWPVQLIGGGLSLLALLGAQRGLSAGRAGAATHALVGLLGGFYVAPLLALASWVLQRHSGPLDAKPAVARARLQATAMQGLHFVFVLGMVGFGISTYFQQDVSQTLAVGDSMQAGPYDLRLVGADATQDGLLVQELRPVFTVQRGGEEVGQINGRLYWEAQTGAHFPLPVTRRGWDGDLYVNLQKACIGGQGPTCDGGGWVQSYKASPRILASQSVGAVQVQVIHLPGLALVWSAWALASFYMACRIQATTVPSPLEATAEAREAEPAGV